MQSSALFENVFSAPPWSTALCLCTDGQLKYFEGSTEDIDFSEVATDPIKNNLAKLYSN